MEKQFRINKPKKTNKLEGFSYLSKDYLENDDFDDESSSDPSV